MSVAGYVYTKLTGSTLINSYTTSVLPDKADNRYMPGITYQILSQSKNGILKSPIIEIKNYHTTQDLCYDMNEAIHNLFSDSTTQQRTLYDGYKIESVKIINSIPARWDQDNLLWYGVTEIRVNVIS